MTEQTEDEPPKTPSPMRQTNVLLPPELIEFAKQDAAARYESLSAYIRRLILNEKDSDD